MLINTAGTLYKLTIIDYAFNYQLAISNFWTLQEWSKIWDLSNLPKWLWRGGGLIDVAYKMWGLSSLSSPPK